MMMTLMDKIILINTLHVIYVIYSFEIIKPQIISAICCVMLIYLDNNRYYSNKFMMGIIYSVLGPFILPFVTIYTIIENCNLFHFKWR